MFAKNIFAQENFFAEEKIPIDAVLVIDVSRSMQTADPQKISRRAMNFFAEKLTENRDRVGVIAYAGKIENTLALHKIENHTEIKNFIDGLNYASWTDHGLGLREAMAFFSDENDERQGIIIFLTDGNMNVNPAGARTNETAQHDVDSAIAAAREKNIPIHTIGLNFDGNLASEYIENISRETRGLFFETADAADIPQIIDAFFCELIAAPAAFVPEIEIEIENEISKTKNFSAREKFEIPAPQKKFSAATFAGIFFFFAILTLLILKFQSPRRVFTGTLEITESTKKTALNLIEHGSRVKILGEIIITPSKKTPSYLPQIRIKTKNKKIKFKKDFFELDSNEIFLDAGAECIAAFDEKIIFLRYLN
ncbi:MAG: VWA domain-containing protein [Defluviitaleaceae bacterium]|nr:VWA domain-containing protein [Defluviitaleaceae bacterium]